MTKRIFLEQLLTKLEENIRNDFEVYKEDEYYLGNCKVEIGEDCVWIENVDIFNNEFTVCVYRKNGREYPNIEKYLSDKLAERIDLTSMAYDMREENEREREAMYETNVSLCGSFGWGNGCASNF